MTSTPGPAASSILAVEDDPSLSSLLKLSLEAAGCGVAVATRAEEGARILSESRVDLVILDLMLPDAAGFSLFPVIILTARDSFADKIRGLEGGADDYVTKPFEPLELIARIRSVLRRRGGERRPLSPSSSAPRATPPTRARLVAKRPPRPPISSGRYKGRSLAPEQG